MPAGWVVVATGSQLDVERMQALLEAGGIPAQIVPGDVVSFLGVSPFPCRLAVPDARAPEAQAVLDELERAAPLAEETE